MQSFHILQLQVMISSFCGKSSAWARKASPGVKNQCPFSFTKKKTIRQDSASRNKAASKKIVCN